jgi:hypothetical protein
MKKLLVVGAALVAFHLDAMKVCSPTPPVNPLSRFVWYKMREMRSDASKPLEIADLKESLHSALEESNLGVWVDQLAPDLLLLLNAVRSNLPAPMAALNNLPLTQLGSLLLPQVLSEACTNPLCNPSVFYMDSFATLQLNSREAKNPHEKRAIEFMNEWGNLSECGLKIDEVRFIDAYSLIGAMPLDEPVKEELMGLLDLSDKSTEEFVPIATEKLSLFPFSDDECKSLVLSEIAKGCKRSRAYRHAIVALIARNFVSSSEVVKRQKGSGAYQHAIAALVAKATVGSVVSFCKAELKLNMYNDSGIISVDPRIKHEKIECRSFFSSLFSSFGLKDGSFVLPKKGFHIAYHEIGHALVLPVLYEILNDGYIKESTYCLLSKFTKLILNPELNKEKLEELQTQSPEFQESYFQNLRKRGFATYFKSIKEFEELLTLSESEMVAASYQMVGETFQIFGCFLSGHDGVNTLYVNSFSDFALELELGLPIPFSHLTGSDCFDNIIHLQSINYDLFGPLFALHGGSMEGYVTRLCFGNRLFAFQKQELRLGMAQEIPSWLRTFLERKRQSGKAQETLPRLIDFLKQKRRFNEAHRIRSWGDFHAPREPQLMLTWSGS